MKTRLLAAILGVGGLFLSGCSSYDRGAAVVTPAIAAPATPIRSQSDLQRYIATTPSSASPLGTLSAGARDRFVSSVTFNAKGITGFHYGDLQSELTASQIYDVLKLFAVEKDVAIIPNVRIETGADKRVIDSLRKAADYSEIATDYSDYWCASRATCSSQLRSICTSNC